MAIRIEHRARLIEEVPARLLTLTLPAGVTLDKWVKMETARLREMYPEPKNPGTELGAESAEMFRVAKKNRDMWERYYQLVKLDIREQLEWGKKALADDIPFLDRRIINISGYHVDPRTEDALFPV